MHLYVRVGDQSQRIETGVVDLEDGSEAIVFKMPVQLDMGDYEITVSTDGMNYHPEESSEF